MATDRAAALETAGAALAAKYLTSGEKALALDALRRRAGRMDGLGACSAPSLRAWRHDAYRTRLKDEQKVSLTEIVVIGAPEGAEAAWQSSGRSPKVSS